jgi:Flp pilus assembly protein TadD
LKEAILAQQLDPLSPFINNGLARQHYLSRQYDKAIAQCQVGLNFDPTYLPARIQLGLAYEQRGMLKEAIAELEKTRDLAATLPMAHALLAHVYATAGRKADAQSELNVLTAMARSRYVPPSYFAIISVALGDKNQAFSYLQKSYQDRSEQLLYLKVEPLVDPLRGDGRFDALLRQIGLSH